MRNILKSDLFKLYKNKAFWICLLLSVAVAVLMVLAIQAGINNITGNMGHVPFAGILGLISGVGALTIFIPMNFHLIFIAVFSSLFVASEFQTGTIKNTISRGAGRVNVFFSKFIVTAFASIVMFLAFVIAIVVTGTILWGFDPGGIVTGISLLSMIALQALTVLAFSALFTFTSMTLRGTGGAIAANVIIVTMASTLFSAISLLLPNDFNLNDYWLDWNLSNLATYSPDGAYVIQGVVIAVGWSVVSIIVGVSMFKMRDIK